METATLSVCAALRDFLLEQLRRDALCHEQGYYDAVGHGVERLPRIGRYRDEDEAELLRLMVLEDFWACWQDARDESWSAALYPGIARDDWPVIARGLCVALEAGEDVATLQALARVYGPQPTHFVENLWQRLTRPQKQ